MRWLSADKEALIHLGSFNFKFYNGQFYAYFHSIAVLRKSNASKMHEFHSLFLQLFDTILHKRLSDKCISQCIEQ